jgi:hypothetical protein
VVRVQLDAFVYDEVSDTAVSVFSNRTRVVVACRGTASARNVMTDLKVLAVESPSINSSLFPHSSLGCTVRHVQEFVTFSAVLLLCDSSRAEL